MSLGRKISQMSQISNGKQGRYLAANNLATWEPPWRFRSDFSVPKCNFTWNLDNSFGFRYISKPLEFSFLHETWEGTWKACFGLYLLTKCIYTRTPYTFLADLTRTFLAKWCCLVRARLACRHNSRNYINKNTYKQKTRVGAVDIARRLSLSLVAVSIIIAIHVSSA